MEMKQAFELYAKLFVHRAPFANSVEKEALQTCDGCVTMTVVFSTFSLLVVL